MVPFPHDGYMRLLAEALYAVAYLEWAVLGDLPRLSDPPPELSVEGLSRLPMGPVAGAVRHAARRASDSGERAWLEAAADAMEAVVENRNRVVHAHPASLGDAQMLFRWAAATATKPQEAHAITTEHLENLRDLAYEHLGRINAARLPA